MSIHEITLPQLKLGAAMSSWAKERGIEDKISTYLAAGTLLVLLVDPQDGTFTAHDPEGAKRFAADETFRHPSMPKQPPTD